MANRLDLIKQPSKYPRMTSIILMPEAQETLAEVSRLQGFNSLTKAVHFVLRQYAIAQKIRTGGG